MSEPTTTEGDSAGKAQPQVQTVDDLPAETLDFAHRMFEAARTGDVDPPNLLVSAIDAGLPVNLTNAKGNTLLMLSAYAGHLALTQALLSRGADPNTLNDSGQSIVAGATFKGHDDIVRVLMEHKADPRAGKPSAIEVAGMFGKKELLEQVLGGTEADLVDVPRFGPGGVPDS